MERGFWNSIMHSQPILAGTVGGIVAWHDCGHPEFPHIEQQLMAIEDVTHVMFTWTAFRTVQGGDQWK